MIKVSEEAKIKITNLMGEVGYNVKNHFVSSGLSYDLNFDQDQNDEDKLFEDNDVRIIINKSSFLYLIGTTLEYSGGLNGKGFVFNNPNAERTCGCGESFSL
jgi:iron-sulfur cluster assembly protein